MKTGVYRACVCPRSESKYPVTNVERKASGSVQLSCRWKLLAQVVDGEEVPCAAEFITSYTTLVNKSGLGNDMGWAVAVHPKLFNWNGRSFKELATSNYDGVEALLTLEEDNYNGQTRIKVGWIDTVDRELNVGEEANPLELDALDRDFAGVLSAQMVKSAPAKPTTQRAAKPAAAKAAKPADDLDIPEKEIPF